MSIDLRPFMVLWVLMAASVLALLAWRKSVSSHEDDSLHVLHGNAVPQQTAVAQKLEQIDKWGKTLTVVTVALGLLLAAVYVYQVWMQSSTTTNTGV